MVRIKLKALCHDIRHNCFLMSSLVQKFRKYGHAQYRGIVYGSMWKSNSCSAKIKFLFIIKLTSSQSLAIGSQRVRILISKGYRTHIIMMLETSNALQRET